MTELAGTRVLLVDGSQLITEGLRVSLHRTRLFRVVGVAHTVGDAARSLHRTPVDLVVTDFDVPGAGPLRTVRDATRLRPRARVVVLSNADCPHWAKAALDAGAVAYLLKTSPVQEILPLLAGAMRGNPATIDARLGSLALLPSRMPPPATLGRLSAREFDVLAEMAKGLDNQRIAHRLFISNDTVKTHVKSILRKLGARDRAHAVAMALSANMERV